MSDKPFVQHNSDTGYTIFPKVLLDRLIGSSLPPAAKLLVLLVCRFSNGYQNQYILVENSELKELLPIKRENIPQLVKGLIALKILKGGACQTRSFCNERKYELSVNFNFVEWDISYPSRNKDIINGLHERANKLKAVTNPERKTTRRTSY